MVWFVIWLRACVALLVSFVVVCLFVAWRLLFCCLVVVVLL